MKTCQLIFVICSLIFTALPAHDFAKIESHTATNRKLIPLDNPPSNTVAEGGKIAVTMILKSMINSLMAHAIGSNLYTSSNVTANFALAPLLGISGAMYGATPGVIVALAARLGSWPEIDAREFKKPIAICLISSCLAMLSAKLITSLGESAPNNQLLDITTYLIADKAELLGDIALFGWTLLKRSEKNNLKKRAQSYLPEKGA
jgi:hypothetical protein